jgi:hypothetical protein
VVLGNLTSRRFLSGLIIGLLPLLAVTVYLSMTPKQISVARTQVQVSPEPTLVATDVGDEMASPPAEPVAAPKKATTSAFTAFFAPDFKGNAFCKFSHQVVTIAGSALAVSYPKGSTAPSAGAPYGGAQLCVPFAAGAATDATLTYDVRFPVGFEFVKGGKLPGMYGGVLPFSGGKRNPNGWSMRLMWRDQGLAEVYGYIANSSGYGDDWTGGGLAFQADGKWHHLAEQIHLNSPGNADGYVTLSYDGQEYIRKSGLAITTTNTPISGLYFSTFYGGHDASWAPSADMAIGFANFHRS